MALPRPSPVLIKKHLHAANETGHHIQMKQRLLAVLPGFDVETGFTGSRVPDLALGRKFAVECQHSPMTVREWESRNADYNGFGTGVLWVWSLSLATNRRYDYFDHIEEDNFPEIRVPTVVRNCYREYWGRVFVMDCAGVIATTRLDRVEPRIEVSDFGSFVRTPKTLRCFGWSPLTQFWVKKFQSPTGFWLAKFEHEEWWKGGGNG